MKLLITGLLLTIGMQVFLISAANDALDSQEMLIREEVRSAYLYACTNGFSNKTIIECGMEASDYIEEYLK